MRMRNVAERKITINGRSYRVQVKITPPRGARDYVSGIFYVLSERGRTRTLYQRADGSCFMRRANGTEREVEATGLDE